jgi:hypothetical protein
VFPPTATTRASLAALAALAVLLLAPACGDEGAVAPDLSLQPDAGVHEAAPDDAVALPDLAPDLTPQPDAPAGPCSAPPPAGHPYQPNLTYWGRNNYIQYVAGDIPVVISAPHGGYLKPTEIPDRTYGVLGGDSNSQEAAFEVAHHLLKRTGGRPHLVINRLHRRKLDANREVVEAAQGSAWAKQAWGEYHAFIEEARKWVSASCGAGLYLDLHTNGHAAKWVELGALLTAKDLDRPDAALDATSYVNKSSIRSLVGTSGLSLSKLVRGPTSLGSLLMARGFEAVPSQAHPHPAGAGFFSGGYNTARHGSKSGSAVDGIQVETYTGFTNTGSGRDTYALALAQSIQSFVEPAYGFSLTDPSWTPPPEGSCANAAPLSLGAAGTVTVTGRTAGADNEFGDQITCGLGFSLLGPQVYYRLQLDAGKSYRFKITPTFPARVYLFSGPCTASSISAACALSGLGGALISSNTPSSQTVSVKASGSYTLAVDSRARAWYGGFILTVERL